MKQFSQLSKCLLSFFLLAFCATSYAQVGPINIGTLPKNKTVKIVYDATINTGLPQGTTSVSHQGTVSGSNFSSVSTNTVVTPLDVPPYVVSITRKIPQTADMINNTEVTYLVTFSETVSNVDIGDFELTKTGTADGTIASVSAATGTALDVVVNAITGDGTLRLDLKASGTGIVDDGGTAITSGFTGGEVYTFDHTAPVLNPVTITSNNTNPALAKEGDIVTLSFTASEDIGVPTVTLATHNVVPVAGAGNSYTATWTLTATDAEGLVPFSISFSDLAGNAGTQVTTTTEGSAVTYDRTPPAVTINQAAGQADPTSSTTINFTVVFSEAVEGFATGDVSFAGSTVGGTLTGTVTEVAPNNGTTFNVAVTGMTTPDGSLVATILANKATDAAGNVNTASTTTDNTVNWISDQPPVVVSINRQSPLTELTNAPSVTFQVTFSEDVAGVDATDFELTKTGSANGSIGTVTPINEHTYNVDVNSVTGDGTLRLDLKSSGTGIKDKDGVTLDDITGGFTTGQTYTIDKTAPALTAVSISSNNANSNSLAKAGDKVTVLFTASESIQSPTVTIHGQAASVSNVAGNQWQGEYTMQISDAPEGIITFSISFTDLAGNNGSTVSTTTDASSVTFDKTAPTLTSVHILSSNVNNPVLAKVGDVVTLSFTASEAISGTSVTIAGHPVAVNHVSGNNYNATYMMVSGDAEGPVTFSISGFTDNAGNGGNTVTSTTQGSNVIFDKTVPTLGPVLIISNNISSAYAKVGSIVTVEFTASEPIQTPAVTIAGHNADAVTQLTNTAWKATYTMTSGDAEGSVPFTINFSDLAGNAGTQVSTTTNGSSVTFDMTAPILTTVTISSNNANPALAKVGDEVTVNFTSSEALPVRSATIATHSVGISFIGGSNYKATYIMTNTDVEGNVPFSLTFSDAAGNAGTPVSATTDASSVTFDRTRPVVASINRHVPLTETTTTSPLTFQVTFSENVSSVNTTDFSLNTTGTTGASISTVTPVSGSVYNVAVTVTTFTGGTVRLDLNTSGTGIRDAAGNDINGGFTAGETYLLGIPPDITNCPASPVQFSADAGQCYATLSKSQLTTGLSVTGAPTPVLTVWIGSTEITGSYNFPVGNTTVKVIASNGILPNDECSFTVTVADNQSPVVSAVTANPAALWPPNHKMKDVQLSYNISDNCGCTPSISITSNQPVDGTGDGDTSPDWEVVNSSVTMTGAMVRLRAERANNSNGRVYTITVSCTDAGGNTNSNQTDVIVAHNISGPITGTSFKIGSTVAFSGVFWDKPGNRHTANWLIDGSTTVKGTVTEPSGTKNGKVTGSYKFTTAGIYKLKMNVIDQDKATSYSDMNEDMEAIVVIYDPAGGYTYGGGYFASPAGALKGDPTATGKANYGFTVNYYKNATNPKGETQFQFKVGEFEYNALNYDYLSVSGYKAVFRGSGKIIDAQSGIDFIMYVIDGALDGTRVDKIRLKIYDKNTGEVYYDNEPGKSDAADPTTPVGQGSTVVISGSKTAPTKKMSIEANAIKTATAEKLQLQALPNPSNHQFTLQLRGGTAEPVNLRIVDAAGRSIEIKNRISTNTTLQIGATYRPGVYFVEAIQGNERVTLKLVKQSD